MPVKILLNGSNGRMGRAISDSAAECGCEIAAACDICLLYTSDAADE